MAERSEPEPFGKAGFGDDAATTGAVAVGSLRTATVRAVVSGKVHEDPSSVVAVGAFLSAMGIQSDADDRVAPPPGTPHPAPIQRHSDGERASAARGR